MRPSLTGPLGGRHILVTRPAGQAENLIAGIEQLGGRATHIPFLAINPVVDAAPLTKIANHLTDYQACIFISANAVQLAWPILTRQHPWPPTLVAATVGPGTANVLRERGVSCVVLPETRYDSEGLLALPVFAAEWCQGRAFALIRGEGGRDLIAKTLRERGAQVDEASAYERALHPDALTAVQQLMRQDLPAAMVVTSSESLQRVMMVMSEDLAHALRHVPIIAPHERIAQVARSLGFEQVMVSAGGDAGILRFLQTYNG